MAYFVLDMDHIQPSEIWEDMRHFLIKLLEVQRRIDINEFDIAGINMITYDYIKCKDCVLCDKKCIERRQYTMGNFIWHDSLEHYIKKHIVKPHSDFIDYIFKLDIDDTFTLKISGCVTSNTDTGLGSGSECNKNMEYYKQCIDNDNDCNFAHMRRNVNNTRTETDIVDTPTTSTSKFASRDDFLKNMRYLKIEKNQLLILEALMNHGGYTKKYHDYDKQSVVRYSEHSGFFEIRNNSVHNIIVSGNTSNVSMSDDEIFLPTKFPEESNYQYLFHTHPPTPSPGGRAKSKNCDCIIIYEFPSAGDILHFIDNFNNGKTIGSIVMTPEGLYNIRKLYCDTERINIDENKLYMEMKTEMRKIHKHAFAEYGRNFTRKIFYTIIAQNRKYIDMINNFLYKYELYIDFYGRKYDFNKKWVVDTIYLPLYSK